MKQGYQEAEPVRKWPKSYPIKVGARPENPRRKLVEKVRNAMMAAGLLVGAVLGYFISEQAVPSAQESLVNSRYELQGSDVDFAEKHNEAGLELVAQTAFPAAGTFGGGLAGLGLAYGVAGAIGLNRRDGAQV